jgi:GNAT superfamily N-acetyltransferase
MCIGPYPFTSKGLEMIEIRRIAEPEGDPVAALWDEMCRSTPDGGPLTPRGRANIARWLGMSAWHHHAFCLVAVDGDAIVGFINGRTDIEDGLLPGVVGRLESVYVTLSARGQGLTRRLAEAGVAWLRAHGAGTIRTNICIDNAEAHQLWVDLGFEKDMVCLSLYSGA